MNSNETLPHHGHGESSRDDDFIARLLFTRRAAATYKIERLSR